MLYEDDDDWSGPAMLGSYWGTGGKVKTAQIGFVRKKDVQPSSAKNINKGKLKTAPAAPKKGPSRKRVAGQVRAQPRTRKISD